MSAAAAAAAAAAAEAAAAAVAEEEAAAAAAADPAAAAEAAAAAAEEAAAARAPPIPSAEALAAADERMKEARDRAAAAARDVAQAREDLSAIVARSQIAYRGLMTAMAEAIAHATASAAPADWTRAADNGPAVAAAWAHSQDVFRAEEQARQVLATRVEAENRARRETSRESTRDIVELSLEDGFIVGHRVVAGTADEEESKLRGAARAVSRGDLLQATAVRIYTSQTRDVYTQNALLWAISDVDTLRKAIEAISQHIGVYDSFLSMHEPLWLFGTDDIRSRSTVNERVMGDVPAEMLNGAEVGSFLVVGPHFAQGYTAADLDVTVPLRSDAYWYYIYYVVDNADFGVGNAGASQWLLPAEKPEVVRVQVSWINNGPVAGLRYNGHFFGTIEGLIAQNALVFHKGFVNTDAESWLNVVRDVRTTAAGYLQRARNELAQRLYRVKFIMIDADHRVSRRDTVGLSIPRDLYMGRDNYSAVEMLSRLAGIPAADLNVAHIFYGAFEEIPHTWKFGRLLTKLDENKIYTIIIVSRHKLLEGNSPANDVEDRSGGRRRRLTGKV